MNILFVAKKRHLDKVATFKNAVKNCHNLLKFVRKNMNQIET